MSLEVTVGEIDEVEAKVTRLLGTASAAVLEEAFGEIALTVPPSAEGKATTLLRTLNRYLNSQAVVGANDEGLSVYRQVAAVLEKGSLKVDDVTGGDAKVGGGSGTGDGKQKSDSPIVPVEVKTEEVSQSSQISEKPLKSAPAAVNAVSANVGTSGFGMLSKLKDFKLTGTIGGDKSMPYTSMVYQIRNGQRMGYPDHVICSAVLSSCAQLTGTYS